MSCLEKTILFAFFVLGLIFGVVFFINNPPENTWYIPSEGPDMGCWKLGPSGPGFVPVVMFFTIAGGFIGLPISAFVHLISDKKYKYAITLIGYVFGPPIFVCFMGYYFGWEKNPCIVLAIFSNWLGLGASMRFSKCYRYLDS